MVKRQREKGGRVGADLVGRGGEFRYGSGIFGICFHHRGNEPGKRFRFLPALEGVLECRFAVFLIGENPIRQIAALDACCLRNGMLRLGYDSSWLWWNRNRRSTVRERVIEQPEIVGQILVPVRRGLGA